MSNVKDFEHDDPMELRAVPVPDGDTEMQATVFIEEFLMMGVPKEELIGIFKNPFYDGAYRLYQNLGEGKIQSFITRYLNSIKKQDRTDHARRI